MFLSSVDRRFCLTLLAETAERYRWEVRAYCLMDSHWHLLVRTPEKTLSDGMRRLNSCYSMTFNRRHHRSGHTIRHKFMSVVVESEAHAFELTRYLPLNPVRGGLVRHPEAWIWSSYRMELGTAPAPAWLNANWSVALHGGSRDQLRRFVNAGMAEPGAQWTPGSDPTLTPPRPEE